jgi:hypothetical protein
MAVNQCSVGVDRALSHKRRSAITKAIVDSLAQVDRSTQALLEMRFLIGGLSMRDRASKA